MHQIAAFQAHYKNIAMPKNINSLNRNPFAILTALVLMGTVSFVAQATPRNDSIRQISMGGRHSCAVTFQGEVLCWGDNEKAQIGDGTIGDKSMYPTQAVKRYPTLVIASGATSVSSGYAHTCATVNGGLQCWGWNETGQVNGKPGESIFKPTQVLDSGVTAVAAGGMHTCAVVRGAAFCWGADGRTIGSGISGMPFKPTQYIASGVTAISAGAQTTCAIVHSALQCWGDNRNGAVGSDQSSQYVEKPVEIFADGVTAVSVGTSSTCAVVHGAALCWGKKYDETPSLGPCAKKAKLEKKSQPSIPLDAKCAHYGTSATMRPVKVIPEGVTDVAVSGASGCAIVHGALQCWGDNSMGKLGAGEANVLPLPTPVIDDGVTVVSMNDDATCALVHGALRCRGYNGYGDISGTIALDQIADSRPFDMDVGDVKSIDYAKADAIITLEKMPEMVAPYLQGKLITHENAVYFVRRAHGTYIGQTAGDSMTFDLDVAPLYPTTVTSSGDGYRDVAIPPNAACGESDLPTHLATGSIGLQRDNGFVDLRTGLLKTFPAMPPLVDGDESFHLHLNESDVHKIESCAKALNDAWDSSPVKAITLNGTEVPQTLDKNWRVPGEGIHGAGSTFTVETKPDRKPDSYVEAQSVSVMQCGALVLGQWKRGLSLPWKLHGTTENGTGYFDLDEEIIGAVDSPNFPSYSQEELRREINLAQGKSGLAPAEEAELCAPKIEGYKYTIRNPSNVIQTVYNPGVVATPERTCQQDGLPTLALRVADKLGHLRGKRLHTAICKAWPGVPDKSIVALVRPQDGANDDLATYDLDVFVVNTKSGDILQHTLQEGAITSDAMHFDGISLDTANYALAHGVRAFGVRTTHSHIGATSSSDETLTLFIPEGKELKAVLSDMTMNLSSGDRGGECNEAHDTSRTLMIGDVTNHGYAQIVITEKSNDQDVKMLEGRCVEVESHSSHRYVLQFDGMQYVMPAKLP